MPALGAPTPLESTDESVIQALAVLHFDDGRFMDEGRHRLTCVSHPGKVLRNGLADTNALNACSPDEWLLVQAWDES